MAQGRWSNLAERASTGGLLAVISLMMIWTSQTTFLLEILLFTAVGSSEIFDLLERRRLRPLRRSGTLCVLSAPLAAYWWGAKGLLSAAMGSFLLLLCLAVLRYRQRTSMISDVSASCLHLVYLGVLFPSLVLIRALPQGAAWITLLILLVSATDTGAYFVGRSLGRVLLCPELSPKKTWEGSLGGLLLPAGIGYLLGPWLGLLAWQGALLGSGVSLVGQLGDLWESAIKREVDLKDAGDFLGSHGGILDRFDSLALASPLFYLALTHWL
jgi:phosphatidate cytidylyltransferase